METRGKDLRLLAEELVQSTSDLVDFIRSLHPKFAEVTFNSRIDAKLEQKVRQKFPKPPPEPWPVRKPSTRPRSIPGGQRKSQRRGKALSWDEAKALADRKAEYKSPTLLWAELFIANDVRNEWLAVGMYDEEAPLVARLIEIGFQPQDMTYRLRGVSVGERLQRSEKPGTVKKDLDDARATRKRRSSGGAAS